MREPAEGRARRKNSRNSRLPEHGGILRTAWTTLSRRPFIFLSCRFFCGLARPTRAKSSRKFGRLQENFAGGNRREGWATRLEFFVSRYERMLPRVSKVSSMTFRAFMDFFFFLDVKVLFCFPFLPCNSFFGLLLSRVSIRDTVRTRYFENYGFLFFFLLCISSFSHLFVPRKTFLRRRSNCKSNFPINETTIFQRCFRCLISSSDNLILNWTAEKRIVEGG